MKFWSTKKYVGPAKQKVEELIEKQNYD